jgi:hypothetical protein
MKKIILILITSILFLPLIACGTGSTDFIVEQVNPDEMIHYSDVESFDELNARYDRYVIYFKTGDTIPLIITLNNDVLETESKEIKLKAKKTIYFMIKELKLNETGDSYALSGNSRIYISLDAIRWVPVRDFKGFERLAGYSTNDVAFTFRVTSLSGITSQLVIDSY